MLNPIIKIHGGKRYLRDKVVAQFPKNYENLEYIEPFIGGGSVFLFKKPSQKETISDINDEIYSIWRQVQVAPDIFIDKLSTVLYSQEVFDNAKKQLELVTINRLDYAVSSYIKYRMSRGGLGKDLAWSNRLRGGIPGDVNAWNNSIKQLKLISQRIKNTNILLSDYKDLILNFNENTLFYLDPPYLHESRKSTKCYRYEMSYLDHTELCELCNQSKSKIVLSGYHSSLYKEKLSNWNIKEIKIKNHSGQCKKKQDRIEVLWTNF